MVGSVACFGLAQGVLAGDDVKDVAEETAGPHWNVRMSNSTQHLSPSAGASSGILPLVDEDTGDEGEEGSGNCTLT
eukprot:CAMPEP_0178394424 /NCGR_PEP_ID=MMETSP0689_2-20121128/12699_1 /TAXON_ID=160604 /ORGANISM="Amphidinium massartii, Strain CS-259" /LENGTH=75 /DNA_ID=CAMNT_0020015053 /DNA_START=1141 /DNA_END=1368 /DNA_ORIENTATION=+